MGGVLRGPALDLPLGEAAGGGGRASRARPGEPEQAERLAHRDRRLVRACGAASRASSATRPAGVSNSWNRAASRRRRDRRLFLRLDSSSAAAGSATRANGGSGIDDRSLGLVERRLVAGALRLEVVQLGQRGVGIAQRGVAGGRLVRRAGRRTARPPPAAGSPTCRSSWRIR